MIRELPLNMWHSCPPLTIEDAWLFGFSLKYFPESINELDADRILISSFIIQLDYGQELYCTQ